MRILLKLVIHGRTADGYRAEPGVPLRPAGIGKLGLNQNKTTKPTKLN